ncbi:uncharacterized protein MYCGRDRAFT_97731 [Zymoseptoria tritici IPO323]|uniref:Uncharacterized protein n=1 Tax=Zymoseptoria tritici (strain CBS 115943 / IPO323) TaxID=336722 RepID=F9XR71_ZYMTI|nr:uncharacterized protein MYCGRDRAFT_97731 [Zymoseptoria tritici IPO323]EGP82262.1 hypothetical protein MYCGRDRAFT_97731 [Zymoseptoria tritici IPO323]
MSGPYLSRPDIERWAEGVFCIAVTSATASETGVRDVFDDDTSPLMLADFPRPSTPNSGDLRALCNASCRSRGPSQGDSFVDHLERRSRVPLLNKNSRTAKPYLPKIITAVGERPAYVVNDTVTCISNSLEIARMRRGYDGSKTRCVVVGVGLNIIGDA